MSAVSHSTSLQSMFEPMLNCSEHCRYHVAVHALRVGENGHDLLQDHSDEEVLLPDWSKKVHLSLNGAILSRGRGTTDNTTRTSAWVQD
jgi:hypothetical protein